MNLRDELRSTVINWLLESDEGEKELDNIISRCFSGSNISQVNNVEKASTIHKSDQNQFGEFIKKIQTEGTTDHRNFVLYETHRDTASHTFNQVGKTGLCFDFVNYETQTGPIRNIMKTEMRNFLIRNIDWIEGGDKLFRETAAFLYAACEINGKIITYKSMSSLYDNAKFHAQLCGKRYSTTT